MKNEKYYIGLDIGTDSVGYAVTDQQYKLCKFKGEPMWGVHLFDEAKLAVERRGFRCARRRLDRRQQRIQLLRELFAVEIGKADPDFYKRIKESYLYPETPNDKIRLFGSYEEQRAYTEKYPTIHHLISELMDSTQPHDVRLVYIACAWLVAHRGHFLSDVDKHRIEDVTDFDPVYEALVDFIEHDDYELPWRKDIDRKEIEKTLQSKQNATNKSKMLKEVLFEGKKVPKEVNDQYEYNYDLLVNLLCGREVEPQKLFGNIEYEKLEKKISLSMDDNELAVVMESMETQDAELVSRLKAVYDWSVLVDVLKGKRTISEAKVEVYLRHKEDLKLLKYMVRKYVPQEYNAVFRFQEEEKANYAAYIQKNKTANNDVKVKRAGKDDFCKYIRSLFKSVNPEEGDKKEFDDMMDRLNTNDFLPKQVDGDNRIIPYQLYWYELDRILNNAKEYIPFLGEKDEDGITGAEKILSVFEFRIPYFVGPLKEEHSPKMNHWMVRKAQGKIYPWNFEDKVDFDESEKAFIERMTNTCTYLPGEDVLPKNALLYCSFEVLNEINNIKIDGHAIPVYVKQGIYNDLFMGYKKVTPKRIKDYLISNGYMESGSEMTGLDLTVKSSLRPYLEFKALVERKLISLSDVERIIVRSTYSEDQTRYRKWIDSEFSHLSSEDRKHISKCRFKDFGRLSKKLLLGLQGTNKSSGEVYSVIHAMWETNCNFMQLLSDKFTFSEKIKEAVDEYYDHAGPQTMLQYLEEQHVSNAVKRQIIRTMDVLKDIVKVKGQAPEMIFVEMARGANEEQKNKRTNSRLQQIRTLYQSTDADVSQFNQILDAWQDDANNKLQSDTIYLYFMQLGKCLYTGKPISLDSVIAGDGQYNKEHIYPREFVKDDSVLNNIILVDSKANGNKSNKYPIDPEIQKDMREYWMYLRKNGLISEEKFKRLIRNTPFTDEERYEFINRQLVETRQSTKVVAELLKKQYENTEIVYVKAGLVSDFRKEFNLLKSRAVNDLHHAKDAYLNIVVGSVWHYKFSRRYYDRNVNNNVKIDCVLNNRVIVGGRVIWNGAADRMRVLNIARKNAVHLTQYAYMKKGGFFDQQPCPTNKDLFPRKKNMPPEKYGGYNKSTASFFVLVKYSIGKKKDIMFVPVELLFADKFLSDDQFALAYAKKTIERIKQKTVDDLEFLLDKRIIKIKTVLQLGDLRVCITGKSGGGRQLGVTVLSQFKTSSESELYIKRLESFLNKKKKNDKLMCSEKNDGITKDQNLALYKQYIEKLGQPPYQKRPANPKDCLLKGEEKFMALSLYEQLWVLLQIQGLFGRAQVADLKTIGGAANAGASAISSTLSNLKEYKDVRIIDQSPSGLFETVSENLLDLL